MNPAIIIVAYNRHRSLNRLLVSIMRAYYPDYNISLVISIDKSNNNSVIDIAKNFKWPYGDKELIIHKERQGLRNHILSCGDLVERFGSIIILEDDLYVSPHFYEYAIDALDFYKDIKEIAGISLYNMEINETALKPFSALHDGYDVYFVQLASSWGQAWTKNQWFQFRNWYNNFNFKKNVFMPTNIDSWPETSWKKYFIKYMICENKFFVYPRISLTTNFGDKGEHYRKVSSFLQVPLLLHKKKFLFSDFSNSFSVYDAFMEILPNYIVRLNNALGGFDFDVDLYGSKPYEFLRKPFVLTSKSCSNCIMSFSKTLKPHEVNVICNYAGDVFKLCDRKMLDKTICNNILDWNYYVPYGFSTRKVLYLFLARLLNYIKLEK